MLQDETLNLFDYWSVRLQYVTVHVMRSSGSLWREQGPLSLHIKSRRWSHCHGAGLGLTAQAQENPCTVNPHVNTWCELPQSLYIYRSSFRAGGWAAGWQDPFKYRPLPLSGISCRLFCPADVVISFLKVGCFKTTPFNVSQLSLCSLSVWMASLKQFSKSVWFCPMHALHKNRLQGQSLFVEVSPHIFLD